MQEESGGVIILDVPRYVTAGAEKHLRDNRQNIRTACYDAGPLEY